MWNRLVGTTYDAVNTNSNVPNEKTREYLEELAKQRQKTDRKRYRSKFEKKNTICLKISSRGIAKDWWWLPIIFRKF